MSRHGGCETSKFLLYEKYAKGEKWYLKKKNENKQMFRAL